MATYVSTSVSNYTNQINDLNERFGRLVKQLGASNVRGTLRYEREVSFAYALNDVISCPGYLQAKSFDRATAHIDDLIVQLKRTSGKLARDPRAG